MPPCQFWHPPCLIKTVMSGLFNKFYLNQYWIIPATLTALLLTLVGCGEQEFKVTNTISFQKAPGTHVIPPKIDILLVEDDTGSIFEAYGPIATQLPLFLKNLQDKGWNYHFAVTPLTRERPIREVLASQHDPNWGANWIPPFPGAQPDTSSKVNPLVFKRPESFSQFLTLGDINNGLNGLEPGFETIRTALVTHVQGTGFLRNDALLVIFVIGNGEDTSGVTLCTRVDGFVGPCENLGMPGGTKASSFELYRNAFLSLKPHAAQVKFFAAVARQAQSNCLGGRSYVGERYQQMALTLRGAHYDVCSQPISAVLNEISTSLEVQRLSFRTRYLFIDQEPNVSTIRVERHIQDNPDDSVEIPQDSVNGWTYEGFLSNVFSIDAPVPLNLSSGFAIELHGSAKLVGNDTATITFKPAGARDSASSKLSP